MASPLRVVNAWFNTETGRLHNSSGAELNNDDSPVLYFREVCLLRLRLVTGYDTTTDTFIAYDASGLTGFFASIDNDYNHDSIPQVASDGSQINIVGDWENGGTADTSLGQISVRLSGNTTVFQTKVNGIARILNSKFELQASSPASAVASISEFTFECRNIRYDSGGLPPEPTSNYYTKPEIDAKFADLEFGRPLGTGWLSGGELIINGTNPNNFDITTAASFTIVDQSNGDLITFEDFIYPATNNISTGLSAGEQAWIYLYQSGGSPLLGIAASITPEQTRDYAVIGRVWMDAVGNIEGIENYTTQAFGTAKLIEDYIDASDKSKVFSDFAAIYSANGANTLLDRSPADYFRLGSLTAESPVSPNIGNDIAVAGISNYFYVYKNATTFDYKSSIDTTTYDNNGTETAATAGKYLAIRLYYWPKSAGTGVVASQTQYDTAKQAKIEVIKEVYERNELLLDGSVFRNVLIVPVNSTDLSTDGEFLNVNKDNDIIYLPSTADDLPEGATNIFRTQADKIKLDGIEDRVPTTGVVVPMYVYPADIYTNVEYNGLIDTIKEYHDIPTYVVLNPANGAGAVVDGNYTAAIKRVRGSGAEVLGYIATNYTALPIADAKLEVDKWVSLYPTIDGIFIDEQANADSQQEVDYYVELTSYIKKIFPYSMSNPGANCPERYFSNYVSDCIITYENSGWPTESVLKGDYAGGHMDYDYKRRGTLVYNIADYDAETVEMIRKYSGLIYVTEQNLPNPWGAVSTHLSDLYKTLSANAFTDDFKNAVEELPKAGENLANLRHDVLAAEGSEQVYDDCTNYPAITNDIINHPNIGVFGKSLIRGNGAMLDYQDNWLLPLADNFMPLLSNANDWANGGVSPTFTRASTRTVEDYQSNLITLAENVIPFEGARWKQGAYLLNSATSNIDFGNSAELQITDNLEVGVILHSFVTGATVSVLSKGQSLSGNTMSAVLSINSTGELEFYCSDDGTFGAGHYKHYRSTEILAKGNSVKITFASGTLSMYINSVEISPTKIVDSAITALYNSPDSWQLSKNITGWINGAECLLSDFYIKSNSVTVLDAPLNGNSNDSSGNGNNGTDTNVEYQGIESYSTDANGDPIAKEILKGYNGEPAATNLIIGSEVPSNQSVTVVDATQYTLSVRGGSATAEGQTATLGNPVTVTSVGTSMSITFNTATQAQIEIGAVATSYIKTIGAPVTRLADDLSFPIAILNDDSGAIVISVRSDDYQNIGTVLGGGGTNYILAISSGRLQIRGGAYLGDPFLLVDGVEYRIGITWGDGVIKAFLNGAEINLNNNIWAGSWGSTIIRLFTRNNDRYFIGTANKNIWQQERLSDTKMIELTKVD
jgi:hypothetical protein